MKSKQLPLPQRFFSEHTHIPFVQFSEVNPGLQSQVYVRFEGAMVQIPSCAHGLGMQRDNSSEKIKYKFGLKCYLPLSLN